jgi:CHASE1-domain containing sensor protein
MHDALIFLANVLLLALVLVGMALLHSQRKNREKFDVAVQEVRAAMAKAMEARDEILACAQEHDRKAENLRQYLNGFAGWLSLQRAIADAATTAAKDKD